MADPRKVPFVTLASFNTSTPVPESKKRRREEEGEGGLQQHGRDGGLFSNGKSSGTDCSAAGSAECRSTVRLSLSLSEPSDKGSTEFSYTELIQQATQQVRKAPEGLTPALDPNDPLADQDRERREVEALARKFESKYGGTGKKKKKDRMQDLIDIGYGYDETDPFIDNSEAYDELVPASLTTKLGGFYINTGTLQFRPASESEDEDRSKDGNHFKLKDGEERVIKRRKKKDGTLEEKKPRKNRVSKQGVSALNRPEKKKRKKLMKDSLSLAAMIRRFTREKEEMRKKNPASAAVTAAPGTAAGLKPPNVNRTVLNSHSVAPGNDLADLTNDPAVIPLLGSANDDMLQDLMDELDFSLLDPPELSSLEGQGENGNAAVQRAAAAAAAAAGASAGRVQRTGLIPPPPLPSGLPAPLAKRIEDLRAASRQFDMEGRKKFFTLDMNNILLDIELQVQEQPVDVRAAVYSHLEAFVPCNKEALLKRLKKLSLNVQDDRLRNPLLKLKLAVCSAMPEQIARYNMDCLAKVAKQQSEEGEKNGSEEEDEERPGKRVMGPRKKFVWDDKLRALLCNLVRAKLGCYEAEGQSSPSPEDYLKAFMETEVKPLWPKGWMQARMLIKESRMAHGHLTGNTVKKTPKAKPKSQDGVWLQQSTTPTATPSPQVPLPQRPPSPSEPICLSDSLDEDLGGAPSLDSISHALALLSSAAKGLIQSNSPPSPEAVKPVNSGSTLGPASSISSSTPVLPKKSIINTTASASPATGGPIFVSSTSSSSSSPSPAISRPPSVSVSPSIRSDGIGGTKVGAVGLTQVQRHSLTPPQRPIATTIAAGNSNKTSATSPPKPRPPPTASPLIPPHKSLNSPMATPPGHHKPGNNSSTIGRIGAGSTTPSSQSHSTALPISSSSFSSSASSSSASSHLNAKTQPKISSSPSPSPSQPKPQPPQHQHQQPQQQSTFVTPMQATLTKSPHSSNSPILKLTPRVTPVSSPSPALSRTPTLPSMHQFSPKTAGFHTGFSGVGASYSTPVGQQKTPSQVNSSVLTSTSTPITKHTSPSAGSANHGPRQRPAGVANQGAKPLVTVSSATAPQLAQVPSSSASLLGPGAPNLPLNFGMLGGITPVSLPFAFPGLLNLPTVTGTSAGANTANQSSSGYSLQPNLLKGLMSGAALPPHLQLAFSDVNQSQSGDLKRKL
ncbi:ubinuclein-2b isoform X2 [Pangasianodon hypophthalmus]|uniref:ubinuclein-2b isoform X2 n=1 Tax=Pangasianodon hypophthalmus TaxID=310915 RepID=UPI001481A352|nr:ubinuclein-2b isoform X2 [Pangasianodon hypophthalmus]